MHSYPLLPFEHFEFLTPKNPKIYINTLFAKMYEQIYLKNKNKLCQETCFLKHIYFSNINRKNRFFKKYENVDQNDVKCDFWLKHRIWIVLSLHPSKNISYLDCPDIYIKKKLFSGQNLRIFIFVTNGSKLVKNYLNMTQNVIFDGNWGFFYCIGLHPSKNISKFDYSDIFEKKLFCG